MRLILDESDHSYISFMVEFGTSNEKNCNMDNPAFGAYGSYLDLIKPCSYPNIGCTIPKISLHIQLKKKKRKRMPSVVLFEGTFG